MKKIYLIRHCKAEGQEPDAPLTSEGSRQAVQLMEVLADKSIEYIVSSPYARAMETTRPLSERMQLPVHTDDRLAERVLSTVPQPNWLELLERTYEDYDMKLEGGESSNEALARVVQVIEELIARPEQHICIVSHGALLSLLITRYDPQFGFNGWQSLSNPDVYLLESGPDTARINRVWS